MSIKTKKPKDDYIEAFSIPEGSVLLDSINNASKEEMILLALKKLIKERKLESDLNLNIKNYFSDSLFYLNDFAIQIVITGITSDQIFIPIKSWMDNNVALGKIRETEESIIGMILKYPVLIKEVMTVIPPDVFYIDIHQEIFKTALLLYSEGKDPSLEDFSQSLKDNKLFNLSGGERILNELVDKIPSDFLLKENVEFLKNSYIRVEGYGESPQIVLGVKVDDENNIVYFQGLITSKDFKSLLENNFVDYFTLQMDINEFKGGIDRLINYVQILDNDSLPKGVPHSQFFESRSKSIEKNRNKVNKKNQNKSERDSSDSTDYYLSSIGRVPLLSASEELELFEDIQIMKKFLLLPESIALKPTIKKFHINKGKKAGDKIMAANLRLVVAVAKKYQDQGLQLLDLVQEGTIGLERAVDKFDPAMGYKFSTYAYWWIRQAITRAIDNSTRTKRLPIHIMEKLSEMRRVSRELSRRFGRQPTRSEMANEMGIDQKDLEALISQSVPTRLIGNSALDDLDKKTFGELMGEIDSDIKLKKTRNNIKILGVGNAGINVLNEISKNQNTINLIKYEYIDSAADTLKGIKSSSKLLIGEESVAGLGTHGNPQYGLAAIKESEKLLQEKINEDDILFVLAGMGGGTGGGASPLIGKIAKEKNILTIAIVSTPPGFEGRRRMKQAEESIEKLHESFDLIVVIPFAGRPSEPVVDPSKMKKEDLDIWFNQLNELEQTIIKLRFGLDGEEPLTLDEIAKQNNLSLDKVRQTEAKAIISLRNKNVDKISQVFNYTNELMSDTVLDLVRVSEQNDNFFNSNFDDIRSLLKDSGKGIVGIGSGSGRNKAVEAAAAAITSSLLQNSEQLGSVKIDQAKGCLLIVKGDKDMNIEDVTSAAEVIYGSTNKDADIRLRTVIDESMKGEIKVMVLLTKFSETSPKGKNLTNRDNLKNRIVSSKKYIDDREVG